MEKSNLENLIEEEHLNSKSEWCYQYTYKVKVCNVIMYLKADTTKVKEYIDMKQVLDDSKELESFITIDLLEKLCSQSCVYYIQKGSSSRRHIHIHYYGDTLEVTINGSKQMFDADEDLYEVYEWIEKTWKKEYKK